MHRTLRELVSPENSALYPNIQINDNTLGISMYLKSQFVNFYRVACNLANCPASFICANIIPIPKGSKVNLSDSDKYRSIAISSILGKILDHIIIVKQSDALTTSQDQYGSKPTLQLFYVAQW